jgi:alanyl-tRNA synthetase
MNTNEIRQAFIDYFKQHGHHHEPSSSLVPGNDPTLLFTNAGMVQFKDVFLGADRRSYTRAVTSQRCVRAGGKHNDLDNVGYTARHHTFFEMLGNFSFGDYFKREAIRFAYEFLTVTLKLPKEKLWVTVFREDDEAASIWLDELKVDPTRFSRCGEADNFWSMGDTGPCGPCTEIFYDHGPDVPGGPPGSPDADGDRYIEIWNLVFMQFDRAANGELTPLPKPCVDTGMGLERIAAVMQGVHSNYQIDLFQQLISALNKMLPANAPENGRDTCSLQVIADHIRSSAFMICDGVTPSNEGRGYVLRRIIRRALRHGHQVGLADDFFVRLVSPLAKAMGETYTELVAKQPHIERTLAAETEQFAKTLSAGMRIFEQALEELKGSEIPGEVVFKLYDTYGFPADLTADVARERQLTLDYPGFEALMAKQRSLSQSASHFSVDYHAQMKLATVSEFTGYHALAGSTQISSLWQDGKQVEHLQAGQEGVIVLQQSPFYAESGGQTGDTGEIFWKESRFDVLDTQKSQQAILHLGRVVQGEFKTDMEVNTRVDEARRLAIMLNHSATHLLHAALREILGTHVQQKGSLVEAERLRFDFAHYEAVTPSQLVAIEQLVNRKIRENLSGHIDIMTPEDAKQTGAMALFGEKYGDAVRVLSFGDFSKELCGGTHVTHTGQIGLFKIVSESGTAAGVRRIEAVTGEAAIARLQQLEQDVQVIAGTLKSPVDGVVNRVKLLAQQLKDLEKQVDQLSSKLSSQLGSDLVSQAVKIGTVSVLAVQLPGADPKSLRTTLDQLKNKLGSSVVVLAAVNGQQMAVVAGVSADLMGRVPPAPHYVQLLCGKGGGRPDMAQGGGDLPADLAARLASIPGMVEAQVQTAASS